MTPKELNCLVFTTSVFDVTQIQGVLCSYVLVFLRKRRQRSTQLHGATHQHNRCSLFAESIGDIAETVVSLWSGQEPRLQKTCESATMKLMTDAK